MPHGSPHAEDRPGPVVVARPRQGLIFRLLATGVVVLVIVACVEVVARVVLVPASNDFRSFATYPGRAAELEAAPGLRVAVFGNSTVRAGVDGCLLQSLMTEELSQPVVAELFVADSAEVTTWLFMMRRFIWKPRHEVDLIVLMYYGDGLCDSREPEIGRLAQFFTAPGDIPDLFRDHLPRGSQRIDFLMSSVWMTWAARDRLRESTLKALVPDHAACSRRLNDWHYANRPAVRRPSPSFTKLGRLLTEARDNGTRVVVVAVPTAPSRGYEVPDPLVMTVEAAGMTFLDQRSAPGITPDLFPDGLHLAEPGRAIYTRILAAELSRAIAREPVLRVDGRTR